MTRRWKQDKPNFSPSQRVPRRRFIGEIQRRRGNRKRKTREIESKALLRPPLSPSVSGHPHKFWPTHAIPALPEPTTRPRFTAPRASPLRRVAGTRTGSVRASARIALKRHGPRLQRSTRSGRIKFAVPLEKNLGRREIQYAKLDAPAFGQRFVRPAKGRATHSGTRGHDFRGASTLPSPTRGAYARRREAREHATPHATRRLVFATVVAPSRGHHHPAWHELLLQHRGAWRRRVRG